MPMYFPDLKSVASTCKMMSEHTGNKKYRGIIPLNDEELPLARIQLGRYFREIWGSEIEAVEVEQALTKENYDERLQKHFDTLFLLKTIL